MNGILPVDDGRCFACGPDNPIGIHLAFERTGEQSVRAELSLAPEFQGWQGIAHGGIAMALLDEGMAHAAGAAGFRGMTGSLAARFRKPVPIGAPLVLEGEVRWMRRHVLGLSARVRSADGTILVEGDGNFVVQGRIEDVADRRSFV